MLVSPCLLVGVLLQSNYIYLNRPRWDCWSVMYAVIRASLIVAPERQGALQGAGGNIEELLPEDEREKRQKEKQQARWTINVGLDPTVIRLSRSQGFSADQRHCQYSPAHWKVGCSILLKLPFVDRFSCGFRARSPVYAYRMDD